MILWLLICDRLGLVGSCQDLTDEPPARPDPDS